MTYKCNNNNTRCTVNPVSRLLGYADDAIMLAEAVDEMSNRLTNFANAALKEADMRVKLSKTHTQIVQQRQTVPTATGAEVKAKERKYKYVCELVQAGCTTRFKTLKRMRRHRSSCRFGYSQITDEKFEIDEIIDVFGKIERHLFLVKWKHHPGEDSWESGHLLMQDGCMDSTKEFWLKSGENPAQEFYPDKRGYRCWICAWQSKKAPEKESYLKSYLTRKRHHWNHTRDHLTEKKDVLKDKLEAQHAALPKVRWDDEEVDNAWQCEYLGSIFQSDGQHLPDIRRRIAMVMQRLGSLRHSYMVCNDAETHTEVTSLRVCLLLNDVLRVRAWVLDKDTIRALNGANATILSRQITQTGSWTRLRRTDNGVKTETDYALMASAYIPSDRH